MDRISDLPSHILHKILSRMPRDASTRTSVLSKKWKHTWSTFPVLNFSEENFGIPKHSISRCRKSPQQMEDLRRRIDNFFDSVDRSLLNFRGQGLAIKQFRLIMTMFLYEHRSTSSHIDHWMKLASESDVKSLLLHIGWRWHSSLADYYCLPTSVLEAKSLKRLRLSGCFRLDLAFLNHPIEFSSLKVLCLYCVYLGDEQVIQNLISSCPLIEHITLIRCSVSTDTNGFVKSGLKSVTIHGLCKLKRVETSEIQDVVVDAPSLQNFVYHPSNIDAPPMANVDRCRNLRKLKLSSLWSIFVNDQWLNELFSKFPLLENLKLSNCPVSEMIKFSCVQLQFLELSCSNMKEINIDAPNLSSFRYCDDGGAMPMISIVNSSNQLKADVQLCIQSYLAFPKLREFLQNFNPLNSLVLLVVEIHSLTDLFNLYRLQEIPVAGPSIKRLDLRISCNETMGLSLFTRLLWSCCPSIISWDICLDPCSRILIKALSEKLVVGKEECCCSLSTMKCWWHSLEDVEIKSSSPGRNSHQKTYVDSKTFLDLLPVLPDGERVSLRLKWWLYYDYRTCRMFLRCFPFSCICLPCWKKISHGSILYIYICDM